jgi:hypothetical protein
MKVVVGAWPYPSSLFKSRVAFSGVLTAPKRVVKVKPKSGAQGSGRAEAGDTSIRLRGARRERRAPGSTRIFLNWRSWPSASVLTCSAAPEGI